MNWDIHPTHERSCLAYFSREAFIGTVSLHVTTEVLIFSFPFSFLHIIKRSSKQRFYAAAGMFAVGFIGVVISLSRVAYVLTTHYTPIISIVNAWGALEQGMGIIICCLPAFKALVRRRWSKFTASRSTRAELLGTSFNTGSGYGKDMGSSYKEGKSLDFRGSSSGSGTGMSAQYSGSGRRGSVLDRESAILRVDSFERMEAIAEAEAARARAGEDIANGPQDPG
ncbi:hypothetical protein TWF730_003124 [Orbilia blumenaviensis]|uniref:Rhodopsin domain-containing protein n=1 Tax=Orbilia blumenaviensis TaxID=1796055 RepID=A0AAV9U598_9PEZI